MPERACRSDAAHAAHISLAVVAGDGHGQCPINRVVEEIAVAIVGAHRRREVDRLLLHNALAGCRLATVDQRLVEQRQLRRAGEATRPRCAGAPDVRLVET